MKQIHLKPILILAFLFGATGFAQANNHANDQNLDVNQLELLAEQCDISAQYELGVMYAEGENISKNLPKAKYYLNKVIKNHSQKSLALVDVAKIYWEMFELWKY